MEAKTSFLAFFALYLAFSSSAQGAVDVTKALSQDPELSTFSELLTKTKLVDQINKLNSATVLAFDNAAAASIAGKPLDVVKKIMSNHIVLEYFDLQKLAQRVMESKTVQLTTLFQSSGEAQNNAGFLNYALMGEGEDSFGSGVKGSPLDAKLVKTVMTQPETLSVLQITEPIVAPGIETMGSNSSPQTSNANAPAPASSDAKSPSPSSSDAKSPAPSSSDAKAPAPSSSDAQAPAPSSSDAKAPASASSDAPAPAPSDAKAPAPASSDAKAPAPASSDAKAPAPASSDAPAPASSDAKAPAPASSGAETPSSSDATSPAPASSDAEAPSSSDSKAPSPSETPAASPDAQAPPSSETPAASPDATDTEVSSPAQAPESESDIGKEGPSPAEAEGDEAAAHESSATSHAQLFGLGVATVLISSLIVL